MAITIISAPQAWTPAYAPIEYTVSSTNYTKCSFKYTADVYVNGTYITTFKLFPNAANQAKFSFETLLQQYVTYDLNTTTTSVFNASYNSYKYYQIKFGEEYDNTVTCDGTITSYPNLTLGSISYTWNGTLTIDEFNTYSYTDYYYSSTPIKFLSNQPASVTVSQGDWAQLSYLQKSGVFTHLEIKTYSSGDTLMGTYRIVNSTSANTNIMIKVGVGPKNIVQAIITGGLVSQDIVPIPFFSFGIEYYTVNLINSAGSVVMSEVKKFVLNKDLEINPRRFFFLGRLGNMDSYTFSKTYTLTDSIQRSEYTKLNSTHSPSLRGRTVIDVETTEKYTSTSGWVSQKEAAWIRELFTSPEVYVAFPAVYNYCGFTINASHPTFAITNTNDLDIATLFPTASTFFVSIYNQALTVGSTSGNFVTMSDTTGALTSSFGWMVPNSTTLSYTPIVVTDSIFETKQKRNIKNISYKINYELSNGKQIQRN